MRLIPAIDLQGGHCVRLLYGNFAAETRYTAAPGVLLEQYRSLGADWLHIVDLDGARDGNATNREIIAALARRTDVKLQVGGGIRSAAAVQEVLSLGVQRVVVGSAAITHPEQVRTWLKQVGAQHITLAFDVRLDEGGVPRVATHGWQRLSELSLWDAVAAFPEDLQHVLCTDVSRDGALSGPNVDLYGDAVRRFPHIEWQASGGVRDARDLHALAQAGAAAAISGKALLEGLIRAEELRPFLPNA